MSIFGSRSQHRNTNNHNSLPASSVARASSSSHPNTIISGSSFLPTLFPRHRSPRPQPPLNFSRWSSTSIPDGGWACEDFMVGVGMVVIQPTTNKMVLLYDHSGLKGGCYFLPKGRKDLGETLQQAALREAYEESGFEVDLLPLYKHSRQPIPPADRADGWKPDTEPIYMTVRKWGPKVRQGKLVNSGGEYFVSWFVGQIAENAVQHKGVGMPDEQAFESYLFSFDEALNMINPEERPVVIYAQHLYQQHFRIAAEFEKRRAKDQHLEGTERVAVDNETHYAGGSSSKLDSDA
ncbi:uncharacterized protein C8R40DRAFT_1052435 [Lentinula edodes]|uniref:uncharacterized protein n=1 Tax=Lentinula edodes TaxID=5353 RepID=UPI001E8E8E78|nr:uncharacterized protein C8R40DRAFT_1052435 [Lentinula edodes]KAH7872482.1 hypothetical protein C8R40DRAFT_1052435 [Lentinula edodes]